MNPQFGGTSIQDLQRNESMDNYDNLRRINDMHAAQYNNMQAKEHEIGHNMAYNNQQAQQIPYYDMPNNQNYPQFIPRQVQQQPQMDEPDIEDLAMDISNSLPAETTQEMSEVQEEFNGNSNGGYLSFLPEVLREPLIILVLYVILSEAMVQEAVGKYVPQMNPQGGCVSRTGVLIYGIILVVLFAVVKKLLL